jgi:antitoxin (DNA-binding transcriptional repressor) of toxin-antitoxin stability system
MRPRGHLAPGGERPISATQAARSFSEVLNRVDLRGEVFVIERGGRAVARIGPAAPTHFTGADFAALMKRLPRPDDEYLDIVEQVVSNQSPIEPPPWGG